MLAFAQDVFALMHDLAVLFILEMIFFVYHFQCVYLQSSCDAVYHRLFENLACDSTLYLGLSH